MLPHHQEPATRLLQYSIPKATPVAPSIRLMDDDQSDISFMSILEEVGYTIEPCDEKRDHLTIWGEFEISPQCCCRFHAETDAKNLIEKS